MQTLLVGAETFTGIVSFLYRTVATLYTSLLDMVNVFTNSDFSQTLNSMINNIYVLVGVFMLFRIGISLLNYLVDPGKLDDKKVGGGQLITHIIISVILLLSLSFIFKWTNELQGILLDKNGILYNIINTNKKSSVQKPESKTNKNNMFREISFKDNIEVSINNKQYMDNENICNNTSLIQSKLKEYIINKIRGGCNNVSLTRDDIVDFVNSVPITYNSSGRQLTGLSGQIDETTLDGLNVKLSVKYNGIQGIAPHFHLPNASAKCSFDFPSSHNFNVISIDEITSFHVEYYCDSSESDKIQENFDKIDETKKEQEIEDNSKGKNNNEGISEDGFAFSTRILSTFVNPSYKMYNADGTPNSTFLKEYYPTNEGSSGWWAQKIAHNAVDEKTGYVYSLDWFMASIAAIAVIVLLITIMIETVIRNLKIVILQAIAPIPVVSYMNPNDKMLNNWIKQYIGAYFSLLIQLFVILITPNLIESLLSSLSNRNLFFNLVVIFGMIIFMKEAPKFIGKLFGIEASGSFGESFKMVKTGLGIGAGAAAGAVAGAVTGFGAGGSVSTVLGGLVGGAFRGAAGGSKGKLFEGASTQVKRNNATKDAAQKGLNWFDRQKGKSIIGAMSLSDMERKIEMHKAEAAKQGRMESYAKNAKEVSLDVLQKGKADALGGFAGQYRQRMDKLSQADAARKNIVRSNFNSDNDYQTALKMANDHYENVRKSIYGKNYYKKTDGTFIEVQGDVHQADDGKFYTISSTGGRIDLDLESTSGYSFEDLAITETFNKSSDNKIQNLKAAAAIELAEFGVDTSDYVEVKAAGEKAETKVKTETAMANKIENSKEYYNIKLAQSLKDGKK